MYFYLDQFHSSKPRGTEFKSNMPGASVVVGMLPGDKWCIFYSPVVNATLVIEHNGSISRSTGALSIGTSWEDEYRIHTTGGGVPLAVKIERYKGYMNQQTIDFKGNMNYTPDGQFVSVLGNLRINYITRNKITVNHIKLPSSILIDGKPYYFKYSYVTYPPLNHISDVTFVGMTDNVRDILEFRKVLYEMGYDYY